MGGLTFLNHLMNTFWEMKVDRTKLTILIHGGSVASVWPSAVREAGREAGRERDSKRARERRREREGARDRKAGQSLGSLHSGLAAKGAQLR